MAKSKYWFKSKKYGFGWVPASWQGWIILLGYVLLIIGNFFRIDEHSNSASDTLMNFIPETLLLTAILVVICFITGENPKMRWGK